MADDIIEVVPPEPPVYNPEFKITWDEIAPSLQKRFTDLANAITDNLSNLTNRVSDCRITIGPEPPLHPEMERDIWIDTNLMVVRFYMSRDMNENNCKWEYTHAAWYGGSTTDVTNDSFLQSTSQWTRVKSLVWVSNEAVNGEYNPDEGLCMQRQTCYTVTKAGYHRLVDKSIVFQYSAQNLGTNGELKENGFIHDGGSMTVKVSVVKRSDRWKAITDKLTEVENTLDGLLSANDDDKAQLDQLKQFIANFDYYDMDRMKTNINQYIDDNSMSSKDQVKSTVDGLCDVIKSTVNSNDTATAKEIYSIEYDSKGLYSSYNEESNDYPSTITEKLEVGDRIYLDVTTGRNPQSTDDTTIYQVADIVVYRLNFGNPTEY